MKQWVTETQRLGFRGILRESLLFGLVILFVIVSLAIIVAPMALAGGRVNVTLADDNNPDTPEVKGTLVGSSLSLEAKYTDTTGADETGSGGWRWWVSGDEGTPGDYNNDNDGVSGRSVSRSKKGNYTVYAQKNNGHNDPKDSIQLTFSELKIDSVKGIAQNGDAELKISADPALPGALNWTWTVKINNAVVSNGDQRKTELPFNQSGLGAVVNKSKIVATINLNSGGSGSAETEGWIEMNPQAITANEQIQAYFLGEGIGLRAFPTTISVFAGQAKYDVSSSGKIKFSPGNVVASFNYMALTQVGATANVNGTASFVPSNPSLSAGLTVPSSQILPPNTFGFNAKPGPIWYDNDTILKVEWNIAAGTSSGVVPGITQDATKLNMP
ncbi:MAG: hypothetical protein AAGG38_02225 [Planctomycetota bacterium]